MCATPAATPAAIEPAAEPCPREPLRNVVLIIEDDAGIASLLKCVLERDGQRVVRARDAAEGVRLFHQHQEAISLLVLDCHLPDGHGASLCQHLRSSLPQLPVVLMSGRNHAGLADLLGGSGPTAFLAKPFFPAQAARVVASLRAPLA